MSMQEQERPCIHVSLLPGADASLYRWLHMGAEEEGVPCRQVEGQAAEPIPLAYEAARSSRFHIGVSLSAEMAVLHEIHMPPEQPVLALPLGERPNYFCRLMGANAARMVVRKPLRFADEEEDELPPSKTTVPAPPLERESNSETAVSLTTPTYRPVSTNDLAQITVIVALVVQKLEERGVR